jgi:hypothetical protein
MGRAILPGRGAPCPGGVIEQRKPSRGAPLLYNSYCWRGGGPRRGRQRGGAAERPRDREPRGEGWRGTLVMSPSPPGLARHPPDPGARQPPDTWPRGRWGYLPPGRRRHPQRQAPPRASPPARAGRGVAVPGLSALPQLAPPYSALPVPEPAPPRWPSRDLGSLDGQDAPRHELATCGRPLRTRSGIEFTRGAPRERCSSFVFVIRDRPAGAIEAPAARCGTCHAIERHPGPPGRRPRRARPAVRRRAPAPSPAPSMPGDVAGGGAGSPTRRRRVDASTPRASRASLP